MDDSHQHKLFIANNNRQFVYSNEWFPFANKAIPKAFPPSLRKCLPIFLLFFFYYIALRLQSNISFQNRIITMSTRNGRTRANTMCFTLFQIECVARKKKKITKNYHVYICFNMIMHTAHIQFHHHCSIVVADPFSLLTLSCCMRI